MCNKGMTRQEILDWIGFLYKDLLMDNVLIGGYYFNLQQYDVFEQTKTNLDRRRSEILDEIHKLADTIQKSPTKAAQAAQNKLYKQLDEIIVTVRVTNGYGDILEVPCTADEFDLVFDELQKAKKDVEYFRETSIQDAKELKSQEEISAFMWFLNDYVKEMRENFGILPISNH